MKKIKITYWIFNGLFAFLMASSAIPDILSSQIALDGFRQLGLPAYLVPFVGVAKALGVIAILVPGFPRLKEWAYAGLSFDLIGATYSIIASAQPIGSAAFMILPLVLAAGSYFFYHKKLKASAKARTQKDSAGQYAAENARLAKAGIA
jgi:uncharacterized membrane protein YphA (DoxX/SURF4 family)